MIERMKATRAGFTLVELIVVIAILGILAGIAIPVYSGYISKANEASDLQLLGAMNTAFAAACTENGIDPTDITGIATLNADGYLTSLGPDAIYEDFLKYYGDNINTPFKVFRALSYNRAEGLFEPNRSISYNADGSMNIKLASGNTATISAAQLSAIANSGIGDMTTAQITDLFTTLSRNAYNAFNMGLDDVNELAKYVESGGLVQQGVFTEESQARILAGLNSDDPAERAAAVQEFTNATTLYSAKILKNYQDDPNKQNEIISEILSGNTLKFIETGGDGGYAVSALVLRGLEEQCLLSDSYQQYYQTKYDSAYNNLMKYAAWFDSEDELYDFFGYADRADFDAQMKVQIEKSALTESGYLNTEQGRSDLNGLISTMSILADNYEAAGHEAFLQSGVNSESYQALIAAALGS